LRVGYVSGDFWDHVVGRSILPLLRERGRNEVEVFCYANVRRSDGVTNQIRALCDGWREIKEVSDAHAVEMIRADRIDILVDLALHSARNRLPVFSRKPAPVQVAYLGYCSTTGLDAIDYRLSDPYLDPPDANLAFYSEETVRLPRSYWCYEPDETAPEIGALPAAEAGYITFGCLNNFAKVSSDALDLWMEILKTSPQARLLLHAPEGRGREAVLERFTRRGILAARLEFVGKTPRRDYLQSWRKIDVALDPFPYGGGITTCDAIWMGVPVVTLSGKTAVGRAGRSILSIIGLPELVAETPRQYLEIAISLAADPPRLAELRSTLRGRMLHSPLCDARGLARDLEAAYRGMWRKWCAKGASP
jgi:predicted O-linked N-acetylglucosamine transferase (SPINDLY family)